MTLQFHLVQLKLISPERRSNDQRKLHMSYILSHACSRPIAERVEADLLPRSHILRKPSVGVESLDILTPDFGVVVDGVAGNRENAAFREVMSCAVVYA